MNAGTVPPFTDLDDMENRRRLTDPARDTEQQKREERLGGALMTVLWVVTAIKWIAIVSAVAFLVLLLIDKPLWIAPIVGVGFYILWRICWRLFWKFIHWSQE